MKYKAIYTFLGIQPIIRMCLLFVMFSLLVNVEIFCQDHNKNIAHIVVDTHPESLPIAYRFPKQLFRVFLKGDNETVEMNFVGNGKYEYKGLPRIYSILLKQNDGKLINYRRAKFYAKANYSTTLSLGYNENATVCNGDQVYIQELFSDATALIKNAQLVRFYSVNVNPSFDLVFRFCRNKQKNNVLYFYKPLISYQTIQITASEAIYDNKRQKLLLKGTNEQLVWIGGEGCEIEKREIEIDLKNLISIAEQCKKKSGLFVDQTIR